MKLEDYEQYYIENSEHYLIPKEVFIELFNEMINWKEESKKQKEVIDKAIGYIEENTCCELRTSKLLDILKEEKYEKEERTQK